MKRSILALMVLLAVQLGCLPAALAQSRGMLVGVDKVRTEPLTQTVPLLGALVARRSGNVAVEIGGTVRSLHVEIGERVKKGQLIALIEADTRRARREVMLAEMDEAKAQLKVAEADLALVRQNLARQGRLRKTTAFNRAAFETLQQNAARATAQIARARAAIAAKEAGIKVLDLEISKSRITAPYDGVVIERNTEIGAYVRNGDPLIKLIADNALEIEAQVPAIRLIGLSTGTLIDAVLEDGTKFKARVRAALPVENPRTRTRPVRLTPIWPQGIARLANAQSVTLHIPVGSARSVVTVHKDAIVTKRGKPVVFIVKDGKAERRNVVLGVSAGGRIEVVGGLKVGDVTVVRGNERLRPGVPVRIVKGS